MKKSSKIYIAGHTGLVGSAIHRKLLEKGYTHFILKTHDELDLIRQEEVEKFFSAEKPEYVIDAAARVGGILANDTYRAGFLYENLMIQSNLIHNAWKHGVKKLLFLGSSCIYPRDAPQPLKEEYLLTGGLESTNEPYAIAKIAGIKLCESYNRQYGCNFISVMPTNLYGPNDNYDLGTSHVLPAMIRKMHLAKCLETGDWQAIRSDLNKRPIEGINGQSTEEEIQQVLGKYGITLGTQPFAIRLSPGSSEVAKSEKRKAKSEKRIANSEKRKAEVTVNLWGTGTVYREFLHADDMAEACLFVMENVDLPLTLHPSSFTLLNIGTGEDLTIRELAEMVKGIVGFNGEIGWDPSKPDGVYRKRLDVSRLHAAGWHAAIGLKQGITTVYNEYRKQL